MISKEKQKEFISGFEWYGDSTKSNTAESVFSEFDVPEKAREGVEILWAQYDIGNWEGSAHVIYRENDQLYEVNASHCSCYGLEDMFAGEPIKRIHIYTRAKERAEKKAKGEYVSDYDLHDYSPEFLKYLRNNVRGLVND